MRPLYLMVRREVLERVRTKSFRWFTLGLFLLVMGGIVAIDRAPEIFGEEDFALGVAAARVEEVRGPLEASSALEDIDLEIVEFEDESEAARLLDDDKVDAFLSNGSLTFESSEDSTLTAVVSRALYTLELQEQLEGLGLSQEQQQELLSPTPVEVVLQDEGSAADEDRQFIAFIAALSLYVTLAVYGNWVITGVVEEKSSRVVEVLLGLVRPAELLVGKTLGILAVALSQLGAALVGAAAGLVIAGTGALPRVALDVVLAAVPLYVLGLLLYSLMYAATGATVSRHADAQSASTPIVMLLLVPYMFAAFSVPMNPDGGAATFLSIFPLTSPLVMPARVATGSPGVVELVTCYGLLLPAIMLVAFVGGRIYAGSILSGGRTGLGSIVSLVLRPGRAM